MDCFKKYAKTRYKQLKLINSRKNKKHPSCGKKRLRNQVKKEIKS